MISLSRFFGALGVALLSGLSLAVGVHAQASRTLTRTVHLDRHGEVKVNVTAGDVRVSTWDRPAVEVQVRIEGPTAERVDDARILVDGGGQNVSIRTEGQDAGDVGLLALLGLEGESEIKTHYTVRMPVSATISVSTQSAPVEVRGLAGDVKVEGASSPVRLRDVGGEVMVATFSGSLDADSVRGQVMFATFSGNAKVRRRTIGADSKIASFSGNAEVILPSDAAFNLKTDITWGGSVASDFELPESSAEREEGVPVQGGGPTIAFESFSGSLSLKSE